MGDIKTIIKVNVWKISEFDENDRLQIQKSPCTLSKRNMRKTIPRDIIVKFLKPSDEENI